MFRVPIVGPLNIIIGARKAYLFEVSAPLSRLDIEYISTFLLLLLYLLFILSILIIIIYLY